VGWDGMGAAGRVMGGLPVRPIKPTAVKRCIRSDHTRPVTTIRSHVPICTCDLAAARAARRRATFSAGVSVLAAPPSAPPPPPMAPLAAGPELKVVGLDVGAVFRFGLGLGFSGDGRDESDGGGRCGVWEGEKVDAEGREERAAGLEKAWGEVDVKRVASMAEEGGRKRRGDRRIV